MAHCRPHGGSPGPQVAIDKPKPKPRTFQERPLIGWREWVRLPDLDIAQIKAKVDTGARSSALHASNIETYTRAGRTWVAFDVHPLQRDILHTVHARAPLLDERYVKNSGGKRERRLVIQTRLRMGDLEWPIELTLTSRDVMGFRMLLGREAVRRRLWIDPGASYLIGERPKTKTTGERPKKKTTKKFKRKPARGGHE